VQCSLRFKARWQASEAPITFVLSIWKHELTRELLNGFSWTLCMKSRVSVRISLNIFISEKCIQQISLRKMEVKVKGEVVPLLN
jgi:hypothetical protein